MTRFEIREDGSLYAAVTLPNVIVGTVGGGTGLPTQKACLEILGLAGATADPAYPLDGEDLMPALRGDANPGERTLFWRTATRAAARRGRWKYLQGDGNEHLFDLSVDPGEKTNLRDRQREIFDRLKGAYAAWNATVLPRLSGG